MPKTYSADEPTLYTAHRSWWSFASAFLVGGLLTLLGLWALIVGQSWFMSAVSWLGVMGVLIVVGAVIKKRSAFTGVTAHHVVVRQELISVHSTTLNLNRIESVDIDQTLFQRMLGYGDLAIRGLGSEDVVLKGLAKPDEFKRAVLGALDDLRA